MFLVPFFVFLTSLFIVYALYLFTARKSDAKRKLLNERLAEAIRSSAHSTDVDVQLAREELLSEIPWLNRSLLKMEVTAQIAGVLRKPFAMAFGIWIAALNAQAQRAENALRSFEFIGELLEFKQRFNARK